MGKIVIMATSDKIASISRQFIMTLPEKEQENVKIINVRLSNAVRIAQGLNPNEVDAVIVRGNTAIVLSNANLPFPIIPIIVYTSEIANAFQQARKLSGKEKPFVGIAGFDQSIGSISALNALLDVSGIQTRFYHIYNHRDIIAAANKGVQDELDVMIGGPLCVEECQKVGLPAIELESTIASILPAYEQAREFQNSLIRQQSISSEDNSLSSYVKELIVSVDKTGCIISSNHFINSTFHIFPQLVKGIYISKHPFFAHTSLEEIEAAAQNHLAILLTHHDCVYVLKAVKEITKKQEEQYILSIYPISEIHNIDLAIRRVLYAQESTHLLCLEDMEYHGLISKDVLKKALIHTHTTLPILISSPCGGGGELLAHAIHGHRSEEKSPFLSFDCQYFVHTPDSSIIREKIKEFVQDSVDGTLFISHLESLPFDIQDYLANIIQAYYHIGLSDVETIHRPPKIILEIQIPTDRLLWKSLLSQRLFFQLSASIIELLPLAARTDDLYKVFGFYFCKYRKTKYVPADYYPLQNALCSYHWPGNLIQIDVFARYIAETHQDTPVTSTIIQKTISELYSFLDINKEPPVPQEKQETPKVPYVVLKNKVLTLDHLKKALDNNNGNRTQAAKELGISRTSFWKCYQELQSQNMQQIK